MFALLPHVAFSGDFYPAHQARLAVNHAVPPSTDEHEPDA